MSDEDNIEKVKQLSYQEIVIDGGIAFSQMIGDFFHERAENFGLLSEIISIKRRNMEWPMNYIENTSMVFSISASIDIMEFTAREIIKCCEAMRNAIEDPVSSEKTYRVLKASMIESSNSIEGELERLIESINGIDDEEK